MKLRTLKKLENRNERRRRTARRRQHDSVMHLLLSTYVDGQSVFYRRFAYPVLRERYSSQSIELLAFASPFARMFR